MTSRGGALLSLLALIACVAGIAVVQPALAQKTRKVKLSDDASALPPPDELRAMTLGYHAAGADAVWAALIVEHGTRAQEKRPFRDIRRYIDGILALDPKHPTLYKFVDSLMIYKPVGVADEDDARATRAYLERGTRELPYSHEVWLQYGQFLAFLGPSFLKDPVEGERWRREGAFAMAQAIDLGADASRSLTVAALLGKAGETKAQIAQLQRAYALTDSVDLRHQFAMKLESLNASIAAGDAVERVDSEWHSRLPFLSRGHALLLGPHRDTAACAGLGLTNDPRCPPDWTTATGR